MSLLKRSHIRAFWAKRSHMRAFCQNALISERFPGCTGETSQESDHCTFLDMSHFGVDGEPKTSCYGYDWIGLGLPVPTITKTFTVRRVLASKSGAQVLSDFGVSPSCYSMSSW